ncbi:hypothetical protein LXL04_019652 [Taraxacum kok-saghyz]
MNICVTSSSAKGTTIPRSRKRTLVGNLSSRNLQIKTLTFLGATLHHLVGTKLLGNTLLSIHLLVSPTENSPSSSNVHLQTSSLLEQAKDCNKSFRIPN